MCWTYDKQTPAESSILRVKALTNCGLSMRRRRACGCLKSSRISGRQPDGQEFIFLRKCKHLLPKNAILTYMPSKLIEDGETSRPLHTFQVFVNILTRRIEYPAGVFHAFEFSGFHVPRVYDMRYSTKSSMLWAIMHAQADTRPRPRSLVHMKVPTMRTHHMPVML